MPKLTDDDVQAFLDERQHLARIATVSRAKRYFLPGTKWAES